MLVLLAVLGVRLYFLQVVNGDYYAERAENQRIRLLPHPRPARRHLRPQRQAPRRLAPDLQRHPLARGHEGQDDWNTQVAPLIEPLSTGLDLDPEPPARALRPGRIAARLRVDHHQGGRDLGRHRLGRGAHAGAARCSSCESSRSGATPRTARSRTSSATSARSAPSSSSSPQRPEGQPVRHRQALPRRRHHRAGGTRSPPTTDYLRGRDGYRKVEVDSRGRIQRELETVVAPQPGQDIVTTIDLELQLAAEEQLRNSPSKRGVIVVDEPEQRRDPGDGLATRPSTRTSSRSASGTPEGRREASALLRDPQTPLFNRAIRAATRPARRGRFRWRWPGLQQGAITVEELEPRLRRRHHHRQQVHALHGQPRLAASCATPSQHLVRRLLLPPRPQDGLDGIMKMVDDFDLNKTHGRRSAARAGELDALARVQGAVQPKGATRRGRTSTPSTPPSGRSTTS